MKRNPLLPLLLSATALLLSCNVILNGRGDDKETPTIKIDADLLAGSTVKVNVYLADSQNSGQRYELYFDDQKMEVKFAQNNSMAFDSVVIPKGMKGRFRPHVKIGDKLLDIKTDLVCVYEWMEKMMPGTAFRVDLSQGTTIATRAMEVEYPNDRMTHYESYILKRGSKMVPLKCYNAKGTQVPAALHNLRMATEKFILAQLWNPDQRGGTIYYDSKNYTARYSSSNNFSSLVMVDIESGNIIKLLSPNETELYHSKLQWMGGTKFCLMPDGYSVEFSTKKLLRFEISDYVRQPISKDEYSSDFQFEIRMEEAPHQANLDIVNGFDHHWISASWDNIYYNYDRMLKWSQLASISTNGGGLSSNHLVFPSYAEGGIYYVDRTTANAIRPLVGNLSHYSDRPFDHFDVYCYPDYTYLRAQPREMFDQVTSFKITRDEIVEINQAGIPIKPFYSSMIDDHYPMISLYDYFCGENPDNKLYRREILKRDPEEAIFSEGPASICRFSASATACTFATYNYQDDPSNYVFYDVNQTGSVERIGELTSTVELSICRLRD